MKITSLLENTTKNEELFTEHGLSLFIETDEKKILFDMGQSDLYAKNSEILGIDLKNIDIAILSHGHYDHGGGLETFLELNKKAKIYINKNAFGDHFSGTEKYIGLNKNLKSSDRIIFTEDRTEIKENIILETCNDQTAIYPLSNEKMNIKNGETLIPDEFKHEQYLIINENGKKIVISGCSHKGILNITQLLKPDILIGGFHFKNTEMNTCGKNKLKNIAEELLKSNAAFYTCHCTGLEQFDFMKNIMKEKLEYLACGNRIIL